MRRVNGLDEPRSQPSTLASAPNRGRVWVVDLAEVPFDATLLSDAERSRSQRIRSDTARREFLRTRTALRRLLGDHLGAAPEMVELAQRCAHCGAGHGPLRVNDGVPSVSVAHTCELVGLVALAQSPIGVDIEAAAPTDAEIVSISRAEFTRREAEHVTGAATPTLRRARFLDVWVRKEAYLKATEEGLARPMASFEVLTGDGAAHEAPLVWSDADDAQDWIVRRLRLPTGHTGVAAAAVTRPGVAVDVLRPPWEQRGTARE